jgi:diguanylate cyclase (GGDEF)-like protein
VGKITMPDQTKFYEGRLTVSDVMSAAPSIVTSGTPLLEAAEILSENQYRHVLVSDTEGNVVGVVTGADLVRHVKDWRDDSQASWKQVPVEAVMSTKFVASSPDADADDVASVVSRGDIQCVPVIEDGQLVGVLTQNDLLMSWNRLDPVLRLATVDPVTELPNRMTFERRLTEEWERASRMDASLAVLMADVDHFKQINDCCGHQTGDAVLHMVARCLKTHLRSYDMVARYGGDEFVAICVACSAEDIDVPVRRVLSKVSRLSLPSDSGRRRVTLSVGAAVISDSLSRTPPANLIAAADKCLYEAKRQGRDRGYRMELDAPRSAGTKMTVITATEPDLAIV